MEIIDWKAYVDRYKDLQQNMINDYEKALQHWNVYGKKEGRLMTYKKKDAVIFCMARYEQNYINEFIEYYLYLGFDHIYLYDDEDIPLYHNIINPKWPVTIIPMVTIEGNVSQRIKMLNHFFANYKNNHYWASCIDVDEFIVLKKHKTIHEFLNEYIPNKGGIGINWVLFGSNNHKTYEDKPVLERFTKCGNPHGLIKTIFVCHDAIKMQNPHFISEYKDGITKSASNNIIKEAHDMDPETSVCQINHYHTKSYGEYITKRQRGTGSGIIGRGLVNGHYGDNQYKSHDQNARTDTLAFELYMQYKNND
jgi:hypothetical protein